MPKRGAACDSSPGEAPAKTKKPNNQGKSELCQLAERFQQQFCQANEIGKDVNLNDVAEVLQVSRRRLYDIVNVLESLRMVSRGGKLTYRWEGTAYLPRLLDTLYAGAATGQSNAAILEGHLPGSCWALTRRMIQQLLLDRGMMPLSVLVQRLEATVGNATTAADAADATAGAGAVTASASNCGSAAAAAGSSSSSATVGRRIYDIGSVLSTFGLVQKTLQGGSGPRYRQPVYQWTFEWQSSLPAGTAMPEHAQAAAAAAQAGPLATHAGHTQPWLWQPQQQVMQPPQQHNRQGAAAARAAAAAAGVQSQSALQAVQQQQGMHQLFGGSEDLHAAGEVAVHHAPAGTAAAHPAAPAAVGAGPALQQRLQQLETLVASILSQNGPKACVSLGQLRALLEHLKQPEQQLDEPQQQQVLPLDEDQAELDAAESLQQLRGGLGCAGKARCCPVQQQQQQQQACCAVVQADSDCSPGVPLCCQHECCQPGSDSDCLPGLQQLQEAYCSLAAAAPCRRDCSPLKQQQLVCCPPGYKDDECCPGMTCFDLLSQLKSCTAPAAAAAATVAAAPPAVQADAASRQQQRSDRDGAPAAAAYMPVRMALPAPAAAAAKSCRCIGLGMQAGYLQGLAQLRAQFGKQYEEPDEQDTKNQQHWDQQLGFPGENKQQQQQLQRRQCCGDAGAVPAAIADAAAAAAVCGTSNDHVPDADVPCPQQQQQHVDYLAFAAEDGDVGEQPPDLRVGSNHLNNSDNQLSHISEEELQKSSAVANLQQQHQQEAVGAAAAAAAGVKHCGFAGSDQGEAAAGARACEPGQITTQQQQRQELSVLEPWLPAAAKALASVGGGSSSSTLMDMHGLQGLGPAAAAAAAGPPRHGLRQQQHAVATVMQQHHRHQQQQQLAVATGMRELQQLQHAAMVAEELAQLRHKQQQAAAAASWAAETPGSQAVVGKEDAQWALQVLSAAAAPAPAAASGGGGGGTNSSSPAALKLLAVMMRLLKKTPEQQQQQQACRQQQQGASPGGHNQLEQLLVTLLSGASTAPEGSSSLQQPQQWQQQQQEQHTGVMHRLHLLQQQQHQLHKLQQTPGLEVHKTMAGLDTLLADALTRNSQQQQHTAAMDAHNDCLAQVPAGLDLQLGNPGALRPAAAAAGASVQHGATAARRTCLQLGAAAAAAGASVQHGASIPAGSSGNFSNIVQWPDTQLAPAAAPPAAPAAARVLAPRSSAAAAAAAAGAGAGQLGHIPLDVLLQLLSAQRR